MTHIIQVPMTSMKHRYGDMYAHRSTALRHVETHNPHNASTYNTYDTYAWRYG